MPTAWQAIGTHVLTTPSVIMITGLNLLSTEWIGKAEAWIVGLKVTILLLFVGVGLTTVKTAQVAPGTWSPPLQLAAGGMIIFVDPPCILTINGGSSSIKFGLFEAGDTLSR